LSESAGPPASIQTPDTVETRIGTLSFRDGAPSAETVEKVYDQLDFSRGVEAFLNSFQGASLAAIRKGFLENGVQDNDFFLFSELMDSQSLFLTGNSDTVYLWGFVDLSDGPMVVDIPQVSPPSGMLGCIDDMWFQWVTDFGLPGPDRGHGGRYLVVGPDYDGPLPDSGFHVSHSRTNVVTVVGRAFMIDNDPSGPVAEIKESFRVYPYTAGADGTAVASYLAGEAPLAADPEIPETKFVEGSGKAFNTIAPNDYSYWELINEVVQAEPADAGDPEILGQLAAVGIVKGKPFSPDERMKGILEDAVAVATRPRARRSSRPERARARVSPTTRAPTGAIRSSPAATSFSTRRRRSPPMAWSPQSPTALASSTRGLPSSIWRP
jgi:hypothetical protein